MNKQTLKPSLITAFQRSYRLKWAVSRIYWALAEREPGESQRKVLQMLALKSDRSAVCYAIRLHRLGGTLPSNADSRRARLWRWLLVNWSSYRAIAWIDWLEKRDTTLYLYLLAHHFESNPEICQDAR